MKILFSIIFIIFLEGVREFVSVLLHELITIYYEVDCTGTNLTKDVFHVLIKNAMSRCSQAVLDANEGKVNCFILNITGYKTTNNMILKNVNIY
jgi:hypothetical protein